MTDDEKIVAIDEANQQENAEPAKPTLSQGDHAVELHNLATAVHESLKRMHHDVFAIGRALLRVKRLLPRGAFLPWLKDEFGWDARTAQRFMSVAARLDGKYDSLSHLGPEVLYKLAARSTPPAVVEEVIGLAEGGELVSAKLVDDKVRKAKGMDPDKADRPKKPIPLAASCNNEHEIAAKVATEVLAEPAIASAEEPASSADERDLHARQSKEPGQATLRAFEALKELRLAPLQRLSGVLRRCDVNRLAEMLDVFIREKKKA